MQEDRFDIDFLVENKHLLERHTSAGEEGSRALPKEVIGIDDRRRVDDTLVKPFRWVCQILAVSSLNPSGPKGVGTGFVIGRRTILTAAHNLVVNGAAAKEFHIYLAVCGDRTKPPLGRYVARTAIAHPRAQDSRYDIAAIFLDSDLPHDLVQSPSGYGALPLAIVDGPALEGQSAFVTGYPKSYPEHDQGSFPTPDEGVQAYQYYCVSRLSYQSELLNYPLDTTAGQSGSPLIALQQDASGRRYSVAIGVHIEGSHLTGNAAVPLDSQRMPFVQQMLQHGAGGALA